MEIFEYLWNGFFLENKLDNYIFFKIVLWAFNIFIPVSFPLIEAPEIPLLIWLNLWIYSYLYEMILSENILNKII